MHLTVKHQNHASQNHCNSEFSQSISLTISSYFTFSTARHSVGKIRKSLAQNSDHSMDNSKRVHSLGPENNRVENWGVSSKWSVWINLAQYTASVVVKQHRGNMQSCRNCVRVRFLVTSANVEQNTMQPQSTYSTRVAPIHECGSQHTCTCTSTYATYM